jgi:hypothetical protein
VQILFVRQSRVYPLFDEDFKPTENRNGHYSRWTRHGQDKNQAKKKVQNLLCEDS